MLGQKSKKNVPFLVQIRTRKFASEIYWPLPMPIMKCIRFPHSQQNEDALQLHAVWGTILAIMGFMLGNSNPVQKKYEFYILKTHVELFELCPFSRYI